MRTILKIASLDTTPLITGQYQEAFVKAVVLAGPEKLSVYGWDWGGQPVICKKAPSKYLATTKKVGDWFVCTHADPRQVQAYLQKASAALKLGWSVELTG